MAFCKVFSAKADKNLKILASIGTIFIFAFMLYR